MSYAPAKLVELDAYLRRKGAPTVGIVGDRNHTYGYHLGKDRLRAGDYSAKHPRDRAGLSNAASAIDVGNHGGLRKLTDYVALAGANGKAPDVREVIGPGFDGRAYRWAAENGFNREGPRSRGDSHEWHAHISYYRDSERRDKVALFRGLFDEEDDDMTPEQAKQLAAVYQWGQDWHRQNEGREKRASGDVYGWYQQRDEHAAILAAVTGDKSAEQIVAEIRAQGDQTRTALAAKLEEMAPELAQAVADQVDHDLDTEAVETALRSVFGGVDGATP